MPIIDAHAFLGAPPDSVRSGVFRDLEKVLESSQISAAVLAATGAEQADFRAANSQLEKELEARANVFGYVSVNPSYPKESAEEVRRRFGRPRFVALKLPRAAAGRRVNSEGFREILHAGRRFGKPVLIDTVNEDDVRDVVALAVEFHTNKFVCGGMGEQDWEAAIRIVEPQLNVFLEIGSLAADRDKVADAVETLSPRRVLFGSHFPRIHPMYVLGMVRDAAISDSDRQRILYRNALELFELELAEAPAGAALGA